jgi:acetyl esterase/lipase
VITVHRDVVYASPVGYRPLALDLYVPVDPRSLCVYVHGGGWRVSSRREGPCAGVDFFDVVAAHGLAVASVDYRLSAEAPYPAQLADVTAAVRYLDAHRAGYGLPARGTLLWGDSAGGHLAAMYGLTAPVDAVVCWYPPTDLDALSRDIDDAGGHGNRGADAAESQLIGYPLDERPDLVAAASPVSHVPPAPPPFLFLHGTADLVVPPRQSQRLADALEKAGGQATVELVDGAGHVFPELPPEELRGLVDRSVSFLLGAAA